jgi:hypothetical protein
MTTMVKADAVRCHTRRDEKPFIRAASAKHLMTVINPPKPLKTVSDCFEDRRRLVPEELMDTGNASLVSSLPALETQPALKMQSSGHRHVTAFAAVTQDAADEVFRIISRSNRLTIRSLEVGTTAHWA